MQMSRATSKFLSHKNYMKNKFKIISLSVLLTATGCASITQSESQILALSATHLGTPVEPDCKLVNDRGSWDAKAPSMVNIRKSGEDLNVVCKKFINFI